MITGLVLDDQTCLLAGASLAFLPLAAAGAFLKKTRAILTSVEVDRRPETRVVRQGGEVPLETSIACTVPEGTRVHIRELLPTGMIRPGETPELTLPSAARPLMTYTILPLVHGSLWIGGIRIEIADRFYRTSTDMTGLAYAGPEIEVLPAPCFEAKDSRPDSSGKLEKDRFSIYKGATIRSFREYVPGDDIRVIDWKLSAKHEKFIVREYGAQEKMPGLIVLDLPDRSTVYDTEEFARLINRVTGEAEQAIRTTGEVSILLISGITLVDMLLNERRLSRCVTWLQKEAYPRNRLYYAYRLETQGDIRMTRRNLQRRRELAEETPEMQEFLARYDSILSQDLAHREKYVFDVQFSRLLQQGGPFEEVRIYSLLCGDISHIRHAFAAARNAHLDSRLISPVFRDGTTRLRFARKAGSTRIEALA
jgi:uncharacterized protein (DUF58 family)